MVIIICMNVSFFQTHQHLKKINIISKALNFLVFQGEIDRMTRVQGRELTDWFELISGSVEYKEKCDSLEAQVKA